MKEIECKDYVDLLKDAFIWFYLDPDAYDYRRAILRYADDPYDYFSSGEEKEEFISLICEGYIFNFAKEEFFESREEHINFINNHREIIKDIIEKVKQKSKE